MSASLSSFWSSSFNHLKYMVLFLFLGALVSSCRRPVQDERKGLLAAAASDLVKALPELGSDFEAKSGVKLTVSYGASGILAQQIENGAPFNVFLSADRRYIEQLVKAGKVESTSRRVYAQGRLVLWSKKMQVGSLSDLL